MGKSIKHPLLGIAFLAGASFPVCIPCAAEPDLPVTCPVGATSLQRFCRFFVSYRKESTVAPQVAVALGLTQGDTTRSIALIVGVSKYPQSSSPELTPARIDVDNLQGFAQRQGFDEVIVVREEDVTLDNLRYFLETYIPTVSRTVSKSRVLFTYSGHGTASKGPGQKGFLVLSDAVDGDDTAHMLNLRHLQSMLTEAAPQTFQFLALINSCYGGDMYGVVQGGQDVWETRKQGGNALTAGRPDELVYSLGGPKDGSLFFDTFMRGIDSGDAAYATRIADAQGNTVEKRRDTIALGDIWKYMDESIGDLQASSGNPYTKPWEGSVYDVALRSYGGFFFLSGHPKPASFGFGDQVPPPGAVSSIPGRLDLKVFNQPEEYSIRGIDISEYSGVVGWSKVKEADIGLGEKVQFAYMRATQGAERFDKRFQENWSGASAAGIVHGAYHVFDLCQPAQEQLNNAVSKVAAGDADLPLGIDIEYYPGNDSAWMKRQARCVADLGVRHEQEQLRRFVNGIQGQFRKNPIIFGNRSVITDILKDQFYDIPLWLHDYRAGGGIDLPGRNPWTIWQYTDRLKVPGIEDTVDGNAFFGTREEFAAFKEEGANVARSRDKR